MLDDDVQISRTKISSDKISKYRYFVSSRFWCKHFYDPDPVEDWKVEILTKFKEQFYKRIVEAPS